MLLGLPSTFASTLSGYITGVLVPIMILVVGIHYTREGNRQRAREVESRRQQDVRDEEISTITRSLSEVTKGLAVLIERVDPVVNNVAKIDTAVGQLQQVTAVLKDRIERMPDV